MKRSKLNINEEIKAIREALKGFPEGASIENIKQALDFEIELRTLQRRLEKLAKEGVVTTSGKTRSTLYQLAELKPAENKEVASSKEIVPLSNESKEILGIVSRSQQQRIPVGYNREFLDGYRPNVDYYLNQKELQKLAELGKTAQANEPAGTYTKGILHRLLIDLSWNSSRLEGNTYSLLDTERLISLGEQADAKSASEAQMILNHKDAIEFIVGAVNDIRFNRYTILNLHALLSNNLLPDPAASGRLRTFAVGIHNSVYTPPGIPQLIEEMFDLVLAKAEQITNPFEQAFFIMVHLPYLQPFDDVNKRVSRLAANIPLTKRNLAPLSFIDVPNDRYISGMIGVYELNRVELLKDVFLWAYGRSAARYAAIRQSIGEPDPFRLKYREPLRTLIADIVANAIPRKDASGVINNKAAELPEIDRPKFVELVETELISLHEGNFARYWIKPSEFAKWKEVWQRK